MSQTPKDLAQASLEELVMHLTMPSRTDADKLRAMFVWIASQDLLTHDIQRVPNDNTALFYLLCAKGNVGSYNTLLARMCK